MIATAPVPRWTGSASSVRAHGEAVLRGVGVPPSHSPGLLAQAISPARSDPFSRELNAGLRSLLGAVWTRDPRDAAVAGGALTGLGSGSTPLGDDYLLGAVLSVWAMGESAGFEETARERWTAALVPAGAPDRTSPLSASLLQAGARGRAPRPLHAILEPARADLGHALGAVTSLGATSGRGCAAAVGAAALLLAQAPTGVT
jgi:hypothetical protein